MFHQGGKRHFSRLFGYAAIGLMAVLLTIPIVRAVVPGDLLINRVRVTGGTGQTDQDAVSFYNASSSEINLNGLRLVKRTKTGSTDTTLIAWVSPALLLPGGIYTWANANNGFAASIGADGSSTQTIANDNAVALRLGALNTGQIIDGVGWGEAANALVEGAPYPVNPGVGQWLERIDFQDTDNNAIDFHITSDVQDPICGNEIIEINETCDDGNTMSGDGCDATCQLENPENGNDDPVHILINEFVSDPPSGQDEWIELYNAGTGTVNLANWMIEDGSGAKTTLTGSIGLDEANRYHVINKPKGALNNAGDIIILRNNLGTIIDQVTYGDWDDGNVDDNAQVAGKGLSVARKQDGVTSGVDKDDFALTATPTKNGPNIITDPGSETSETDTTGFDYTKTVVISEIFPNPIGIDSEQPGAEFIELYNRGEAPVNLSGWRIDIGGRFVHEFPSGTKIDGKSYLTVRSTAGFSLNNSGASIKLHQPLRASAVQTVTYKEAPEGFSYALVNEAGPEVNLIWRWTLAQTPEQPNRFMAPPTAGFSWSQPVEAGQPIRFDSSDTDMGGGAPTYVWNFGDDTTSQAAHPEHIYTAAGSYAITLTVNTIHGTSSLSKKVSVATALAGAGGPDLTAAVLDGSETLRLNEIFPNPKGADGDQEWVELKNIGHKPVNLTGWSISTKSKTGKPVEKNIAVAPGGYVVLDYQLLPGALGNANETLTLRYGTQIIDTVSYTNAPEEQSYALIGSAWAWTKQPTPGQPNALATAAAAGPTAKNGQNLMTGTVVALPGNFSVQYFYFKPDSSPVIHQVYNAKKLFPDLAIGDRLSITGAISDTQAGPRLKTSALTDITKIGSGHLLEPHAEDSETLASGTHPRFVKIQGEVVAKKSPRITLADSGGEMDLYLAKGTGLSVKLFEPGDKISAVGITRLDGEKVSVMPRSKDDIEILTASTVPDGTGSGTLEERFAASARDKHRKMIGAVILVAALLAGASLYAWKRWREKHGKNDPLEAIKTNIIHIFKSRQKS